MTRPMTAAEVDELVAVDAAELLAEATSPAPKLTGPVAPAPRRKPPKPADDPVKAPHGWTYREGAWRARRPAGRPAGKKAPGRVASSAPTPSPQAAKASAAVLGKTAAELAEGLAFMLAAAPLPPSALRVRARLQASILGDHSDAIGKAAAVAAPHVPWLERGLARLAGGAGGAWILPFALAIGPVVVASVEVWRSPVDDTMAKAAEEIERSAMAHVRGVFTAMAAASEGGTGPEET